MNTYYSFTELPNIDPIIRQILSLKFLPDGWHYGEGRGAERTTVDAALRAYRAFQQRGITRIEVFPDVDGGILLSGYYEDETIEILCGPKGNVHVLYERDDEIAYDEDYASVDEATAYLRELPWNLIGISSDYFILDISVGKKNRFKSLAFNVSSTDGGISSVDAGCAKELSNTECRHIRSYYSSAISGEPPVFWKFRPRELPDSVGFCKEPSGTGDPCHINIRGLTKGQCRKIVNSLSIDQLEICDDDGTRVLTIADIAQQHPPPSNVSPEESIHPIVA